MSNPKNRKIQSLWYNSQSYKNYIAQLEAEQKQIDESKKPNPNNLIKRIYSMDSGLITPVLFSLFWDETWTDDNPTWLKSSSQTITPFGTFFDNETKTIIADNTWLNCYYSSQANLGTVIPGQAGTLILSSNVDLHLNSLAYSSSLNFTSSNFFTLSYEFLNYFPGFTYFLLDDIKIKDKNQLFWDGIFSGNISVASLGQNYSAIYLVIERVDTLTQTEFIFVKYGTNSLPIDNPYGSFKIISLTDWTTDGVSGVNIYNSMNGFGFDMTKEYVIKGIKFAFYNAKAIQFAGGFPYSLTADLAVTLNNIKIKY